MRESTPPARPNSCTLYFWLLGASLTRKGVLRERASMSFIVKSTLASLATASKWSTVLVEAPMAMSIVMALRKA